MTISMSQSEVPRVDVLRRDVSIDREGESEVATIGTIMYQKTNQET